MIFEKGHLYHVYNQGNNRVRIFYSRENYLFFLKKMRTHIIPYANIIAWCLMPNHFHIMLEVTESGSNKRLTSNTYKEDHNCLKNLNHSIGKMLSSYTRAINKQEKRTGSLFREHTKAICLTEVEDLTPVYFNTFYGTILNCNNQGTSYLHTCFNYIHLNPVKANLCKMADEWEFSSYLDYYGERKGSLVNRDRAFYLLRV